MPRAVNLLRSALHYRRDSFSLGLAAAGLEVVTSIDRPERGDVLLIWNRYGAFADEADRFEAAGATVLVAENCPFGNEFRGGSYSIATGHVLVTGGVVQHGGPDRWDSWAVPMRSWRDSGGETIVLEQRGIGHPAVRSPTGWAQAVLNDVRPARIRRHPGNSAPVVSLSDDLRRASAVITWSSAAAIQALQLGVPVWHAHPSFAGAAAARPLSEWPCKPLCDDELRLGVFRRLAWGIWTIDEIRSGQPFARLLGL